MAEKKAPGIGFIETDARDLLPLKKLDRVLEYLLSATPYNQNYEQILNGIDFKAEGNELTEILEKLERDGYVIGKFHQSFQKVLFHATFDGRQFINEHDGYMQQTQTEYLKRKFEKEKEEQNFEKLKYDVKNSKRIFITYWWTFGFAVAGFVISAILAILQLTHKATIIPSAH